jgi:HlyD family secretion protein
VLAVRNEDLQLRPGMTATAEIVTQTVKDVLLVPNAALRYRPDAEGGSARGGFPMMQSPGRMMPRPAKNARVNRGSQQTLYVMEPEQAPRPITVTVGASDGTSTIVSGPDVKPGLRVVTSVLAKRA